MAENDIANGFIPLDPNEVGDSYAHSPQGADSRGPMKNWRTNESKPQETDRGEVTDAPDTGSYEGHTRPKDRMRATYNVGQNGKMP